IDYALFQKTVDNLKTIEALDNLIVKWPNEKDVAIHVPVNLYYSTCFKTPKNTGSDKFVYFYDGKALDEKKIILAMRVHMHSKSGEILHLKKSEAMSGKEALELGLSILKKLKIRRIFLHDASYFEFKPGVSFLMRVYVPIISDDGRSFYGKREFYPLLCRNLEGARNYDAETEAERKTPIYNQDPVFHKEAVHFIRNMQVSVFINEVITDTGEKEAFKKLCLNKTALTLHQLAVALFNEEDRSNFIKFNQIALKRPNLEASKSLNEHRFKVALETLYSTKILVQGDPLALAALPDFYEITDLPKSSGTTVS
ncbi:MAG: hypothetical protein ACK4HV_05945, partial [Parachlamydiaceae bacterium]